MLSPYLTASQKSSELTLGLRTSETHTLNSNKLFSLTTLKFYRGLIYKTSYDKYTTTLQHVEGLRQMYDKT